MTKPSTISTILREPLFHFLLIGAGLFIVFSQMNTDEESNTPKIIVDKAKIELLSKTFSKMRGITPTQEELDKQIKYEIREQVLYREAIAIGLEKEDMIIRRRLAQKMKYIFSDLSLIDDPSDEELDTFIENNPSKFTTPAALSFSQVFIDPKKHVGSVDEDAKKLLQELRAVPLSAAINLGDRSLLSYDYKDKREGDIINIFGDAFTKQALNSSEQIWEGPIKSAYGIHFIYIHKKSDTSIASLSNNRAMAEEEWLKFKQEEANEAFYQSLYKNYEIIVDDKIIKDASLDSVK